MRRLVAAGTAAVALLTLSGCDSKADVASHNLSVAADNFQVERRVVFYNGITGEVMLEIDGLCSLGNNDAPGTLSVTCKVGDNVYKKHFLGLSDNVTYFVEQLQATDVSTSHYRVIWKPSTLVPNIDIQ